MDNLRRFPAPWVMEEDEHGFRVRDANGFCLCGVTHREDLHARNYQCRQLPLTGRSEADCVSPKSKLTKQVKKPRATWVDPVYVADVEYRDITSEGLLRQSSFKGLKRST